ncbi:MAG TPA: glutamate-1-semialdehyde 2,1-aminomutase [Methanocorpusculum sp.]|nr:glutamate-1-semialdehyde 2,1-aminomutase [Methanocorpusculum sp.]
MNNEIAGPASKELFEKAKTLLPGGVSSPVRAIRPYPFYTVSGTGSHLTTADGTSYIDCCLGYGPLLLGHQHPAVKSAVARQLDEGWLFGTPSRRELELAEIIIRDYPSIDMLRFVSTGCEATMSALRLARGFTGKSDVVKVSGGFHGAHDSMLVAAGSGAASRPDSLGVPADLAAHTCQVPYNDAEALETLLSHNADIAAFIIEPVMGNCGVIPPEKSYLRDVREITKAHDVLLIFDEVITGYRLGLSGAQGLFGIRPDLTTLGKIAGGGLPIGVFGGRRDIMELVAPEGNVYNAGTFNANPLSMAAGIAALTYLHEHEDGYTRITDAVQKIRDSVPRDKQQAFCSCGPMFKYFFRTQAPKNYAESKESDTESFRSFWEHALAHGVFLPPSQFESNFLSFVHTDEDIEKICEVYACL